MHEGGKNIATLLFIEVLFIKSFPRLFFCKRKNKIIKKKKEQGGISCKIRQGDAAKGCALRWCRGRAQWLGLNPEWA